MFPVGKKQLVSRRPEKKNVENVETIWKYAKFVRNAHAKLNVIVDNVLETVHLNGYENSSDRRIHQH